MNRRIFLGAATAASAANVLGANEKLRTGVIGAGGRGCYLAGLFQELGTEVNAVCDVYEPHLENGLKKASSGAKPYLNYRQLLDNKEVDAVIITTPDHLHAQMMIDAVSAGKDVYLEKPMAHNIEDGFRMVDAVRRTKCIVQVGTQRRSNPMFFAARDMVQSGQAGEVKLVNSWWYNYTRALRTAPLQGKLDWDQFLGPTPKRALDPTRYYSWLYFWDYAGGLMTGQGAHIIDAIQMIMGSTWPAAVTASSSGPNVPGAEVPETACMCVEFPEKYLAVFTVGYRAMRYAMYNDQLKQFNGSKARFDVGREFFALYPQTTEIEMKPSVFKRELGSFDASSRLHVQNFLDCVRSRKEPNAPIELGNYTNVILSMAMQSLRSGRRIAWDANAKRAVSS